MATPLGTRLICAAVRMLPRWMVLSHLFQFGILQTYYRYYCPGDGRRARDCVRAGDCGCNNQDRYKLEAR